MLAKFISISLIFVFIFSAPFLLKNFWKSEKWVKFLFIFNVLFLVLLLAYSIFYEHNSMSLAVRFFIILILMLAVFFLPPKKAYVNIFLLLAVLHSIFLIMFEIYIVSFGGPEFAGYIRSKVMNLGLGDIYTYNQYFYRIQIKGNPILPVAFLISLFAIKSIRNKIAVASLLFVGTFVAGNLAFILAIVFFFGMYVLILFFSNKRVSAYLKNLFSSKKRIAAISASLLAVMVIAFSLLYPYLKAVHQD